MNAFREDTLIRSCNRTLNASRCRFVSNNNINPLIDLLRKPARLVIAAVGIYDCNERLFADGAWPPPPSSRGSLRQNCWRWSSALFCYVTQARSWCLIEPSTEKRVLSARRRLLLSGEWSRCDEWTICAPRVSSAIAQWPRGPVFCFRVNMLFRSDGAIKDSRSASVCLTYFLCWSARTGPSAIS